MLGLIPGRKSNQPRVGEQSEAARQKLPLFNRLTGVRHIDETAGAVVGWAWKRYCVWEVMGKDSGSDTVINGWSTLLNAIDRPIQALVRQHRPDMGAIRGYYMQRRPEDMRTGRVGQVADSLVEMLEWRQDSSSVVQRRCYVVSGEAAQAEVNSLLVQAGFRVRQQDGDGLWDLYSDCASGMGPAIGRRCIRPGSGRICWNLITGRGGCMNCSGGRAALT